MKYTMAKVASAAAVTSLALGAAAIQTSAASELHTTYYGCESSDVLVKLSINHVACPKADTSVTGKFAGANFSNAILTGANLTGASLKTTNLYDVTSGRIIGRPASLPHAWHLINGFLIGPSAVVAHANLAHQNFASDNLSGVSFYGANLSGANFVGANMTNVSLSNANISKTRFAGASFQGVVSAYEVGTPASLPKNWNLVDGNYDGAPVPYLIGPFASIGGAQLGGATFVKVNLDGIYMPGSKLVGASFENSKVENADLSSSNLEETNFTGANLTGTNFTDGDFEGSNFTNANFTKANFTGARLLSVAAEGTANFTGAICPDGVEFGTLGANC